MKDADNTRSPWWRAAVVVGLFGLIAAAYAMYPILGMGSNPEPLAGPPPGPTSGPGTPQPVSRALATGPLTAFVLKPQRPTVADLAFADVAGKPLKLSDWRGRVALVNLWATWCAPCRKEIPHFVKLLGRYKDKGLAVVGINYENKSDLGSAREGVRRYAKEIGMNYPCVMGDAKTQESVPGFQGFPTTLILDRSGKVRIKLTGYQSLGTLAAVVETLLGDTAARGAPEDTGKAPGAGAPGQPK